MFLKIKVHVGSYECKNKKNIPMGKRNKAHMGRTTR